MKILLVTLLFLAIGLNKIDGSSIIKQTNHNAILSIIAPRGKLEDKFLNIIKELTNRMCHEIPKFELPRLDPFNLEFTEIGFIPNFEIELTDIEVTGLSNLEVPELKIGMAPPKFSGKVELDNLNLRSNYTLKGEIPGFMEIDGKGQLSLDIGVGIEFMLQIKMTPEKKLYIEIQKLEPKLVVNKFRLTGLFEDEELNQFFEDMVQDLAAEMFDDFWNENKQMIIDILQPIISTPLADLTMKELLALIQSDEPIFDESDPPPNCKD